MSEIISPILRWAGGKRWLIKHLDTLIPKNGFKNYHEPFLGGGAIFLALKPGKISFLSDLNKELIETYKTIKTNSDEVINILGTFENTKDFYYEIRNTKEEDPVWNAAKFIYLNQTSFNGIYRVNLKGVYNVPYGFRKKNFLEANKIRLISTRLKSAELFDGDFYLIKGNIKKGDLIFLDPPYTVSHNDNGFIKYNQRLFSIEDQLRLSSLIDFIKKKDSKFILTNAYHPKIREIFDKGDKVLTFNRASLIGGTNAERAQTTEFIFTNIN